MLNRFTQELLNWYRQNKRDLPLRKTKDPYHIWLSEVIMQQTRISQGLPYYYRFIETYPTVAELAAASEQEILHIWQGLGYYSRACNLHQAAQDIMERLNGRFPSTYEEILRLKGVGLYTAAAIASIAFDYPHAVVDGNVIRFLSRYYGIQKPVDHPDTRNAIACLAEELLHPEFPGEYNQALMEFGALVCTPTAPSCSGCIFRKKCLARRRNLVHVIPIRKKRAPPVDRYFHYLVILPANRHPLSIYLNKRSGNDIWKHLYDFPMTETLTPVRLSELQKTGLFNLVAAQDTTKIKVIPGTYEHRLTHQRIVARFYRVHGMRPAKKTGILVPVRDLSLFPLPRLITRFLTDHPLEG